MGELLSKLTRRKAKPVNTESERPSGPSQFVLVKDGQEQVLEKNEVTQLDPVSSMGANKIRSFFVEPEFDHLALSIVWTSGHRIKADWGLVQVKDDKGRDTGEKRIETGISSGVFERKKGVPYIQGSDMFFNNMNSATRLIGKTWMIQFKPSEPFSSPSPKA